MAVYGCAQNASAQEVIPTTNSTADIEAYTPDYFVQYAPRTALDMTVQLDQFLRRDRRRNPNRMDAAEI